MSNQGLKSPNGRFKLILEESGNMIIKDYYRTMWETSSGFLSFAEGPFKLLVSALGKLHILDSNRLIVWSAYVDNLKIYTGPYKMNLTDDGRLIVVNLYKKIMWESTPNNGLSVGISYFFKMEFRLIPCLGVNIRELTVKILKSNTRNTLKNGEKLKSKSGKLFLSIENNNLYLNKSKLKVNNHEDIPILELLIDDYGEIILFGKQNKTIWKSNTRGLPGVYNVSLSDSGNITVFNNKNKSIVYNKNWLNFNFETEIDDPKNLKLIVPIYFYPKYDDLQWNRVASVAQKIKTIAIVGDENEKSIEKPNDNYVKSIKKLKSAGVEIIGHVNTQGRNYNQIKTDIKSYFAWDIQIRPNGIFLKGQIENLKELQEYVANNFGKDTKIISTDSKADNRKFSNYPIESFQMTSQSNKVEKIAFIRNLKNETELENVIQKVKESDIRYIYLTDKSDFKSLPTSTYFDKEIKILESEQRKISLF
jgi:hypothetical protein